MANTLTYTTTHRKTRTFTGGGSTTEDSPTSLVLNDTSTPPVTAMGVAQVNMTAGAATLDLTAIATTDGRTVNLNALKVRTVKITALGTNANPVTVAKGAANGYTGFGASFSETVRVGGETVKYDGGNGVAVDATHKTLDLTGTLAEGVLIEFTAGA